MLRAGTYVASRRPLELTLTCGDASRRIGIAQVRVVHGFGSGALRRAVHEFLATTPYCTAYREAEPTAGGAGVTIAELA